MASDELHKNYEDLHEGTRESWASICDRIEAVGDKDLAAELRRKHNVTKSDQERKHEVPKNRRAVENPPSTATGGDL